MLNLIYRIVKRIIMSFILLYTYNKFAISFNAVIPINFITIFLVSVFGVPIIICLVLFLFVCM